MGCGATTLSHRTHVQRFPNPGQKSTVRADASEICSAASSDFSPRSEKYLASTAPLEIIDSSCLVTAPALDRHLVLHFDVNKTIVMADSVTGKSSADIANTVLASCSWGAVVDNKWQCKSEAPSVTRPAPDLVAYIESLSVDLPGKEDKEMREILLHKFTDPGEPGAALRPFADAFLKQLQLPAGCVGTKEAYDVGLLGTECFIIPAFFETLLQMRRRKQSFTLVFRTFGDDLGQVVHEFNAFCEGRHPLFPGSVMDGTDGGVDYRLDLSNPSKFGTFFRQNSGTGLILGTFHQPREQDNLEIYSSGLYPHVRIVEDTSDSFNTIHLEVARLTSTCGTLAFRDYYPYWRANNFSSTSGKLLLLESGTKDVQHIFFDDNILYDRTCIVHAHDVATSQDILDCALLSLCHIARAEPWEAVFDRLYFIHHIERLCAAHDVQHCNQMV